MGFRRIAWETAWALIAFGVSVVALVAAFKIAEWADDGFGQSAVVRLAVVGGAWPLIASVAIAFAGTTGVGRGSRLVRVVLVTLLGSAGSAFCAATLVLWIESHFGRFDPEFIGPTVWLPFITAILTQGIAWSVGLERQSVSFPVVVTIGSSALIALLIALNVPGAFNGITPSGLILALSLVAAAVVTAGGLLLVVRRPSAGGGGGRGGRGRGGLRAR